jgi:hypothetical protein
VDVSNNITLEYGPTQIAQLSCSVNRRQPCRAVIEGTEGNPILKRFVLVTKIGTALIPVCLICRFHID